MLPWPARETPDAARRLVATLASGSAGKGTAEAAIDVWCYMQDEGDLQGGHREFLCLAGNLWVRVLGMDLLSKAALQPNTSPVHPILISAVKDSIQFDAFSK